MYTPQVVTKLVNVTKFSLLFFMFVVLAKINVIISNLTRLGVKSMDLYRVTTNGCKTLFWAFAYHKIASVIVIDDLTTD